ncbi:MAG: hypothetical protein OEZ58_07580 [Gammaproteobacteria bacterium]|nr:hypothetical protein [Gammaproteobacteria bacterium]MDH5728837.1 hypothetical protein [Gammaproteobacteria bacterium]
MQKFIPLLAGGLLLAAQAQAHHVLNNFDIGEMAQQADSVFRGTVVDVSYASSNPVKGQGAIPHTFVTFTVDEVLHGTAETDRDNTYTLRFIGGQNNKGVMWVDQLPKFNIGDEDILFVKGNGEAQCPLVECANGRFRIVDGMMHNEYGQAIVEDAKGRMTLGAVNERIKFAQHKIGKQTLQKRTHYVNGFDGKGNDVDIPRPEAAKVTMYDAGSFIANSHQQIHKKMPNDPLGVNKRAVNVNKTKAFELRMSKKAQ